MSKTDMPFDDSGFETYFENHENVSCDSVMNAVKSQCGFESIGYSDRSGVNDINFTLDQLLDKTCRQLMEMVATAMCGVWIADNDGGAVLSCFGQPYNYLSAVSDYSEINMQGAQKITKLVVTDTESDEITEFSTGEYGTVFAIETPFAEAAPAVWERIQNQFYTAWNCEKALLTDIYPDIPPFSRIAFGEQELMATSFTISVDSTGVYFSGGSDPQDEEQWRYEDYTQRQLNERVQIGKAVGNTIISANGDIIIRRNLNNQTGGGLNGKDNGISVYVSKN